MRLTYLLKQPTHKQSKNVAGDQAVESNRLAPGHFHIPIVGNGYG